MEMCKKQIYISGVGCLLMSCFLVSPAFSQSGDVSYEDKLKKYRADSLAAVKKNELKQQKQKEIQAKNAVLIESNNALAAYKRKRYQQAVTLCDKAIAMDAEYAKAYYIKGIAQKKLRKYKESVSSLQLAVEKNPNNAAAFFALGGAFDIIGKVDEALKAYDDCIAVNQGYYKAYYQAGLVHMNKKKSYEKAIEYLKTASEKNPKYDKAFNGWGDALIKQKKYRDATKPLQSAVAVNSKNYLAWWNLSVAYNNIGNYSKGLDAAKQALKARPKFAAAAFEAGNALKHLGKWTDAKQYFTRASKDRAWRKSAQYEIDTIAEEMKKKRIENN